MESKEGIGLVRSLQAERARLVVRLAAVDLALSCYGHEPGWYVRSASVDALPDARDLLRRLDRRATSVEIARHLGVGDVAAMAVLLSRSELFDHVRGRGYGLVEWEGRGHEG